MTETPLKTAPWTIEKPTAVLVLSDGTIIEGKGVGAEGVAEAEICFNTSLTGYQEVLTDPSYTGQIVTFTFPHIGNVGTNDEDSEQLTLAGRQGAVGIAIKADITASSNYRSQQEFNAWLQQRGIIGISNIDTRALTILIREKGAANAVIAHDANGNFDLQALKKRAANWHGLENLDLATQATSKQSSVWNETSWVWNQGYITQEQPQFHIVAVDYGIKRNMLRLLADLGTKITIVPATTTAEDILSYQPDGIFLSNGPGDPAATGIYAVPVVQKLLTTGIPIFGVCLGHQILALAAGGKTEKMHQGHHGDNHPVKDLTTGKVQIVSMNHGFTVDSDSLPDDVEETHTSLFDGTNCGLRLIDKPVFSVQHHPEASPGPQDSVYLFRRFINHIRANKGIELLPEHAENNQQVA